MESFKIDTFKREYHPIFRSGITFRYMKHGFLRASAGQGIRFPSVAERFTETTAGLIGIFPNPFRESVNIEFETDSPAYTQMRIFDALGVLVETLVDGHLPAGTHSVSWRPSAATRAAPPANPQTTGWDGAPALRPGAGGSPLRFPPRPATAR